MTPLYNYKLFHTPCLSLASELLEETPEFSPEPELQRPVIGVILLSDTAMEAAANYTIETTFRPEPVLKKFPGLIEEKRRLIAEETNPVEKLKKLADRAGYAFDKGIEPWQSVADLRALRNALVHYNADPTVTSDEGRIFRDRERERLENRARHLGTWEIWEEQGGTWLEVFLNRPFGEWAYESANRATSALREPPWRKSAGSDSPRYPE